MKRFSVIISLLLAFCLLFTAGVSVFAEEDVSDETESSAEESVEESSEEISEESSEPEEESSELPEESSAEESSEESSEEVSAEPEPIGLVQLSVAAPKVGDAPAGAVSSTEGVAVTNSAWDPDHDEFENGKTYKLTVEITSDRPFAEDCVFMIGDKDATVVSAEETAATVYVEYTLDEPVILTLPDTEGGRFDVSKGYTTFKYENGVSVYGFKYGASVTVTFTPDEGLFLESVTVNGASIQVSGSKFETVLKSNVTLVPVYSSIPLCDVTVSTTVSGGITDSFVFSIGGSPVGETFSVTTGSKVTLEVTSGVDQVYIISSASFVSASGGSVECTITENRYIEIENANEGTLYVAFDYPPNAVIITQAPHGTITASTLLPRENETVIFTFIPDEGYELDAVVINDVPRKLSTNTYEAIAAGTLRVTAQFKEIAADVSVTLNVTSDATGAHGKANIVGYTTNPAMIKQGTYIGVNTVPDSGYQVASITVNGTSVTPSSDGQTRIRIERESVINVTFEKIKYRITAVVTKQGGGSITADLGEIVKNVVYVPDGENITFTFTPDMNYRIYSVKVDSVEVYNESMGKTYTFRAVKANHTIAVTFASKDDVIITHSITANASANGTITPAGRTEVIQGETVVYTVTPDDGYEVDYVNVDGLDVSLEDGTYTFEAVSADHTIRAYFKQTATVDANLINVDDIDWTAGVIRIDATAKTKASKKVFEKLVMDFTSRTAVVTGSDHEVTFPVSGTLIPYADVDLSLLRNSQCPEYAQIGAAVSSNPQYANCIYSVVKFSDIYPSGAQADLRLGTEFADMEVGCFGFESGALVRVYETLQCGEGGRVQIQLKEHKTLVFISKQAVLPTYDVNVIVGENGSVSPNVTQNVESGMPVTFDITPDKGYVISRILVNGEAAEAEDGKLTITVTGNTTVDIRFALAEETESGSKAGLIISIVIIAIAVIGGAVLFFIKLKQNKY